MITNLHKIIKIGHIIWSLLPFAVVFLKLAYLFCVQIVRKQLCFNFFSTFGKFYGLNLCYTGRYCCLEYIYVKKWILKKMVITSFCRGRAAYLECSLRTIGTSALIVIEYQNNNNINTDNNNNKMVSFRRRLQHQVCLLCPFYNIKKVFWTLFYDKK